MVTEGGIPSLVEKGDHVVVDEEIISHVAMPQTRILNFSPNNAKANSSFPAHAAGAITFVFSEQKITCFASAQNRRKRTASS